MAKYKFYINRIIFSASTSCLLLSTQPLMYGNFVLAHQNQCYFQTIPCYLNFNLLTFLEVSLCPRPGKHQGVTLPGSLSCVSLSPEAQAFLSQLIAVPGYGVEFGVPGYHWGSTKWCIPTTLYFNQRQTSSS